MNLEKELQNQFDLIDSGATMQINRDEDGFIRARVNPMPYLRSPMRQAQPQSLEQTIDELPTVLGGAAGGAVAGSLGGLQDIFGLIYGAGKGMAAEEGQKMQTFLDTATEISDKYGSGAVKGFIRDKAEEAGLDEQKLGILDEAMMAGEFAGIGGLAKGAVTAAPKMASKAADVVQDAGEAAKARMAGGTTLSSGVNPDAAIAAAGDAIAKFRAPTEKKPGIIAFHGSGADFDEFKLEKIGTGEGAQAYGYGLYFTDSEDIARYYRNAVTGMDRFNQPDLDTQAGGFTQELGFDTVGGTHSLSSADPEYDYYIGELDKFAVNKSENLSQNSKTWEFADGSELTLQTEGVMTFDGKPLDSVYTRDVEDRFGVDIKRIAEEARKMGIRDDVGTLEDDIGMIFSNLSQGLFNKKDAKTAVESLAGPSGPGAPSRYETIYSHFIEPKIDMTRVDYLMNAGQKKGKMYKVGLEPKPEDMLDYDKSLREQPKFEKVLSPIYDEYGVAKTADIGTLFEGIKSQRGIMPKDLSKKLSDAGIPGIKYRAAGSRAASVDSASAEYNYVIFDDKMIKILEKYGIVGPVAITGVAASQQEGESDGQSS